jgi:hypothetical protein
LSVRRRTARWAAGTQGACCSKDGVMSILMGLDQHRAQIPEEWIETQTRRDSPAPGCAPRIGQTVREFLDQFAAAYADR